LKIDRGTSRRSAFVYAAALCLAGLGFDGARAAGDGYVLAPAPSWIDPVAPDLKADVPLQQVSDGAYTLLSDLQVRVGKGGERVAYRHFATKAVNAKGVESVANIAIGFDPSYQMLTLHSVSVIRDGRVVPKLGRAQVRLLQRESGLEYQMLDGSRTASIVLDDVRIGDTVDYAYSISGTNPVFGDKQFGGFGLQFREPVERVHVRLLIPADRRPTIVPRNTPLRPAVEERGGYRIYVWNAAGVAPLRVEDGAPGWYDPYPAVQWSEFSDWAEVAHWAVPLYRVPQQLGPALREQVERIQASSGSASERFLAAVRLVQGEVRYLGIEIGANTHAPNPPDLVFERRFGDCKDKALLTVALLGALGIAAEPALVSTDLQRGVASRHPGPDAFNHVIVRAHVDGKEVWVDPTRPKQDADLAHLFQPSFGQALVVAPGTTALTVMPPEAETNGRQEVRYELDARSGFAAPAHYTVSSTFEGRQAEQMRYRLASRSRDDLQNTYRDYYARYYPRITMTAPLDVRDDAAGNRIETTEHYDVAELSNPSANSLRREVQVEVPDLLSALQEPSAERKAPLELTFPLDLTTVTTVLLPSDWTVRPETTRVVDPSFSFERNVAYAPARLTITDRFRTKADHVLPADLGRYADNLAKVRAATGYLLTYVADASTADASGSRFNWTVAFFALPIALLWIGAAMAIYRRDPPPAPERIDPSLEGLGGWLILPAIGTVLAPFQLGKGIVDVLAAMSPGTWAVLTTPGSDQYHVWWAPVLLTELAVNIGLLVFSLLVAVMFFQRRRGLPMLYVGYMACLCAAPVLDALLARQLPTNDASDAGATIASLMPTWLATAAWCAYFMQSRRVKSTFTRGRGEARVSRAAADARPHSDLALAFPERMAVAEERS